MMILSTWSFLIIMMSVAQGQFFYNYDDDRSSNPPPEESYDPSQYQYNSPSATNQQFLKPRQSNPEPPRQVPVQRTQGRSVSRRQEPEPEYFNEPNVNQDYEPKPEPVQEQRVDYHQERRVSRRRHRQQSQPRYNVEEPTSPPRVYSPSVFQNIGLGQAPSGVYVPQDSLLNILSNPERRNQDVAPYSPPVQRESRPRRPQPEVTYSSPVQRESRPRRPQPEVTYQSNQQPQQRFFVQPPSEEDQPRQRNLIVPITRNEDDQHYAAPPDSNRQYARAPPVSSRRSSQRNQEYYSETQAAPDYRRRVGDQQQPAVQDVQSSNSRRQKPRSQIQPSPVNQIDEFEDDFVRDRPPVRAQRRNDEQRASAPRPRQRSEPVAPVPETRQRATSRPARIAMAALPSDTDGDGIPGEAGVDYPTLHVLPETTFSCGQQAHNGYYADLQTSCQVVHLCQAGGVQNSFLCPNGTIFNQEQFSCQWWYKVNCADSPRYYGINDSLYKVPAPQIKSRE